MKQMVKSGLSPGQVKLLAELWSEREIWKAWHYSFPEDSFTMLDLNF